MPFPRFQNGKTALDIAVKEKRTSMVTLLKSPISLAPLPTPASEHKAKPKEIETKSDPVKITSG
jgi:hypothetical protein